MDNLHHPTGFTYDLSLVPDYPGYEWLPQPDENGRTIYKPHLMETSTPEAMDVRRLNYNVDCLLAMAKQKVIRGLEENLATHREIGKALTKWRSEMLVRIHPREVEELTIYQHQLIAAIQRERESNMIGRIKEGFKVEVDPEADALVRQQQAKARRDMGLPPVMHEGFKK
ncbi:hypothetical protein HN682_08020 [Candidatus Peregrinibacteria bacterium]|jgi:hypothetical protein|nr:hypothetical protein [Candidatus Peregrinibacteria bacterium]